MIEYFGENKDIKMTILDGANIIRQKRKNIKVSINDGGMLDIFCPLNLSYKKIEELLLPKTNLIKKKIELTRNNFEKNKDLTDFKKVVILGKYYPICVTDKAKKACFSDEIFYIPQKYFEANKLNFIIKKTLVEISSSVLTKRVEDISYKTNLSPTKILVGNFKSKWGSCDSLKTLKLNWKVIMLKQELIDFIIFHELCHLKELNHSRNFYKMLEKLEPNHRIYRKQLKDYNCYLNLY